MIKKAFVILLFAIAFFSGNMLLDKSDTQIHKTQKGQEIMFPSTYNPQTGSDGISLQGDSTLQVIQGSSPNLQPAINADQLNSAQLISPDSGSVQGATTTQNTYVDPYAAYGGISAYNNLVNNRNAGVQSIVNSSNEAATNAQGTYGLNILDLIHGLQTNQQSIDRKSVQNESSKIQGNRDILSMVGQGIQSGGVRLAQGNAGSSSASQAIANAYAQLGQRQASQIGNQYAQNASDIGVAQGEQNWQLQQAPAKFHEQIMGTVNSIVSAATQQLQSLDQQGLNASLPDRIAIDQQKESIKGQVLAKLQQFDQQLTSGVSGIAAADRGTNIASANSQLAAGQADPNLFNYTTEAPVQVQNTGPIASTLPIFTYNKNKQQTA